MAAPALRAMPAHSPCLQSTTRKYRWPVARGASPRPATPAGSSEPCYVVRKNLRSGTAINYPGNVLVLGDVNLGSCVIAGGDIHVWGR
jgi:septum formation inhibitor MinC